MDTLKQVATRTRVEGLVILLVAARLPVGGQQRSRVLPDPGRPRARPPFPTCWASFSRLAACGCWFRRRTDRPMARSRRRGRRRGRAGRRAAGCCAASPRTGISTPCGPSSSAISGSCRTSAFRSPPSCCWWSSSICSARPAGTSSSVSRWCRRSSSMSSFKMGLNVRLPLGVLEPWFKCADGRASPDARAQEHVRTPPQRVCRRPAADQPADRPGGLPGRHHDRRAAGAGADRHPGHADPAGVQHAAGDRA